MSAFLGPVHHWMYDKIKFQENFTGRLLSLSANKLLPQQLADKFGSFDTKPLELIIDPSNIHGWLSQRVQCAENRFSDAVIALLAENDGSLTALSEVAYKLGQEHAVPLGASVSDAYEALDAILLDGMPCAGGRTVENEDDDGLTFQYDNALHVLCNQGETGLNAFTTLREALLHGMLAGSKLQLMPLGVGTYKITQEG